MYSSTATYDVPVQGKSTSGALVGAAVGAVVGAVVLAAVVTVDRAVYAPSSLYASTAVQPAVNTIAAIPTSQRVVQSRALAGAQFASESASYQNQQVGMQAAPQGIFAHSWSWALLAAVAGAVNGLFLWNNRRVSMAGMTGRREALMAGVAAAGMAAGPAFAAYGDAANVFGKAKDVEQFISISGDGWSATIPSKYNGSKEKEVAGQVGRWEDNFDAVNNAYVAVQEVGKTSISELGNLDQVRDSIVQPLLGKQAYEGPSISEGGFAPGRYSSAAVLDQKEIQKNGKTYYFYELLTRTADGNEGGRHQLFSITVSNGKLYIFKTQAGDKRWFKGLERPLRASLDTFVVA